MSSINTEDMPSRRTFLALGVTTMFTGCMTKADDPSKAGVDEQPDPTRHIYGANGEWSSFGCNASNTRSISDGKAPVDGVSERWRVEVPQLMYDEPIVSNGRIFLSIPDRLDVYDVRDGSELWTKEIEPYSTPLVRDGTVYVGDSDRLLALDAKTGETKWKRTFDARGVVLSPATAGGEHLYVPVGETVYRVDAKTGDIAWSRRLFGTILGSPLCSMTGLTVTTEAGKLYSLDRDGTGYAEWKLPSKPQAPPTADTDGIYVNCLDSKTYGIRTERTPRLNVDWHVETGWANGGLAVGKHLYASGTGGLRAIDLESGDQLWKRDTGNWRYTAPVLGRDTLFVGGDKLFAFDPTPSTGPLSGGPALRFEKSFHGRVGPGPVLNDGVLYVVAQTGEESYHLLALH